MNDHDRQELGAFLRSRRLQLTPEDVGLIRQGRRRTTGLRREEVAYRAAISLTWYTWIEQGREVNFSVEVLESIARALALQPHETRYIFTLCGLTMPQAPRHDDLDPALIQLVEHQGYYPAYVMGRYWQLLYLNPAARLLFGGIDDLPAERQNVLWQVFGSDVTRHVMRDWEQHGRRLVAEFRAEYHHALQDRWLAQLLDDLCAVSPEFQHWWGEHQVGYKEDVVKVFQHPNLGEVSFTQYTLRVAGSSDMRVVVEVPDPLTDTEAKLRAALQPTREWMR